MIDKYSFQTNKTLAPDIKDMSSPLFTTKLSNEQMLKLSLLKFQQWPGAVWSTLNFRIYKTRTSFKWTIVCLFCIILYSHKQNNLLTTLRNKFPNLLYFSNIFFYTLQTNWQFCIQTFNILQTNFQYFLHGKQISILAYKLSLPSRLGL